MDSPQTVGWLHGRWANSSGQYSIYLILIAMIVGVVLCGLTSFLTLRRYLRV